MVDEPHRAFLFAYYLRNIQRQTESHLAWFRLSFRGHGITAIDFFI